MTIDTGKLVSNSNLFQKKIKESANSEGIADVSKVNHGNSKISADFADIRQSGNTYRSRVIENNSRLTNYESNYNRLQFIEQQLGEIESLDIDKDRADIASIVDNSIYNKENIFSEYATNVDELYNNISQIKAKIEDDYAKLDEEFKAIEIANQNILSLNPMTKSNPTDQIANLTAEQMSDSIKLSTKRVLDLIS